MFDFMLQSLYANNSILKNCTSKNVNLEHLACKGWWAIT